MEGAIRIGALFDARTPRRSAGVVPDPCALDQVPICQIDDEARQGEFRFLKNFA